MIHYTETTDPIAAVIRHVDVTADLRSAEKVIKVHFKDLNKDLTNLFKVDRPAAAQSADSLSELSGAMQNRK